MIDIKNVIDTAKKEMREEREKEVKAKLKGLYQHLEHSRVITRNIEREIELYLAELDDVVA